MKKLIKATKIAGSPLPYTYWKCPYKGCQDSHFDLEDELLYKEIICSLCSRKYKLINVVSEATTIVKLIVLKDEDED